jgi:Fur family ferric uptake transcriptional regulator
LGGVYNTDTLEGCAIPLTGALPCLTLGSIPDNEGEPLLTEESKYRMTRQRRVILEEVKKDHSHPTADVIYERVRKRLPRISMGTVYRNLDILASSGLIHKLEPGLPQMRFDGNTHDHYHLTCVRCGKIEDASIEASDDTLEDLENALGHLTKYGIFGHKLEFLGLCRACQEKEAFLPDEFCSEGGIGGKGKKE